jgi:hypothetical protein
MPWLNLCRLPEDDLKAIYAFLKTSKPVQRTVDTQPLKILPSRAPAAAD